MRNKKFYGGVEAGGTKFICGIGTGGGELLDRLEIHTGQPHETLDQVANFFRAYPQLDSIGIGSFGPIELNHKSPHFGKILNTPKPGWININIYTELASRLHLPMYLVTDTDVAAIGEHFHGKALGIENFVYVTVGTGIGGTIVVNGKLLHGISHPEIGHIRVPVNSSAKSQCPYHTDCLEGYASGKALHLHAGLNPAAITDPSIWAQVSQNVALGIVNIVTVVQPEMIILGGSVMKHPNIIGSIRNDFTKSVNNYFKLPHINKYIVHASSDTIGVLGAIKLASVNDQTKTKS